MGPSFPTQLKLRYKTLFVLRKILSVDAVWGNYQCSEICAKQINILCEQNIEFFNLEPGGAYSKHWALNVVCKSNRILRRNFYRCTVHSGICRVHSPTNALLLI